MASPAEKGNSAKNASREDAFIGLPTKITALLKTESDRGVILILAAYLEEILGIVIAAACVTPASADAILNHRQPAGDFDSRMLVAHAFGLIHEEDVKGLKIVQRIRNKAAHFDRSGRGFDVLFDSPPTIDQVVEFFKMFSAEVAEKHPAAIRAYFIASARNLATRLMLRRSEVQRVALPMSSKEKVASILQKYEGTAQGDKLKALHKHPDLNTLFGSFAHLTDMLTSQGDDAHPAALAIMDAISRQAEIELDGEPTADKTNEPTA